MRPRVWLTIARGALAVTLASGLEQPALAAPPGEVVSVRFQPGAKNGLTWDATPGATSYVVHRGDGASLRDLATSAADSCIVATTAGPRTGPVLWESPGAAGLHWFVVTAVNPDGEGTEGPGSTGARALDTSGPCCAPFALVDDFDEPNGAAWAPPWAELGSVDVADVQGARGRFRPTLSNYSLARLGVPFSARNLESTITIEFEDVRTQGVGLYHRSNGGYLNQTNPPGAGYALFLEGFRGDAIGVWREVNGQEQEVNIVYDPSLALTNGTRYRARFRVHQALPTATELLAKVWRAGTPEPFAWNVRALDFTPVLQGTSGGLAVDSWSVAITGNPPPPHTFVDDIRAWPLCSPLDGIGPVTDLGDTFQFTEGPVWWRGAAYFTDVRASTIYRHVPPGPPTVARQPSAEANGLAVDVDGTLLAAEHASRSITRMDASGNVTVVVDRYQGMRFNSPNDIAVRSDGTIYFTDPEYGMADPGLREIPFNGLYRLAPGGALTAEWQAAPSAGPNGVRLSPDEATLYVAESAGGVVYAFDVAPDGSLSGQRVFASGLTTPDGLAVDALGNVFIATWAGTVEAHSPDGGWWGRITLPRAATNCAFVGDDGRTLLITAGQSIHSVTVSRPGLR